MNKGKLYKKEGKWYVDYNHIIHYQDNSLKNGRCGKTSNRLETITLNLLPTQVVKVEELYLEGIYNSFNNEVEFTKDYDNFGRRTPLVTPRAKIKLKQ